MAIKADYQFNGLEIPDTTIRIVRLWGSSREGWDSLVEVTQVVDKVETKLTEFNHKAEYKDNERGYCALYTSLMEKYGGVKI